MSAGDAAVAHQHRPQLAVDDAHHGAHAAFVGHPRSLPARSAARPRARAARGVLRRGAARRRTGWLRGRRCRRSVPDAPRIPLWEPGNNNRFSAAWRVGPVPTSAASSSADSSCRLGGSAPCKRLGAQRFRPAARWVTEFAAQEPDHRIGNVEPRRVSGEFVGADVRPDQGQCEITDHLARRRHLHQPAQHPVGGGIIPRPVRTGPQTPARSPADADSTTGRRGFRGGTPVPSARESRIQRARTPFAAPPNTAPDHTPPTTTARCRTRCAPQRPRSRQRGLAGGARQRRRGTVDGVGAGLPRLPERANCPPGRVVGCGHPHRQIERDRSPLDQLRSGRGRRSRPPYP